MTPKEFYAKNQGRKYDLGNVDCFKMVYDYVSSELDLPEVFDDLTLETYVDLYEDNPAEAVDKMILFFESTLIETEPYKFLTGDVLILEYEKQNLIFPAVFIANTNVIIVTAEKGICIGPLDAYKIRRCFKCQLLSLQ